MLQASLNNKLRLVNFETGKVAKTYTGHKNSKHCSIMTFVTSMGSTPLIGGGSEDGSLLLWDVNTKKVRRRCLHNVVWSKSGDVCVCMSVCVWGVRGVDMRVRVCVSPILGMALLGWSGQPLLTC